MADKKDHFETASATTDPDNQNSGPFAYIITAVTLGVLVLLGVAGVGCASFVIATSASNDAGPSTMGMNTDGPVSLDEEMNELEEFLNQYTELDDYDLSSPTDTQDRTDTSSATVAEILDYVDLAPYGSCIDDEVRASAYAGTPNEVRDFVRSLLGTDKEYTQKVVAKLDEAARDESKRQEKIREACDICAEASKAMDAAEIPAMAKDKDGVVKDELGSAKSKAAERWDQMGRELALLDTTEKVSTRKLWNYDDDVVIATDDAAQLLEDAMEDAANQ